MTNQDINIHISQKNDQSHYKCITVKNEETAESCRIYFGDDKLFKKIVYLKQDKKVFQATKFPDITRFCNKNSPFFQMIPSAVNNTRSFLFFDKDIGVSYSVITDMTGKLIDYHKYMGQLKCSIRSSKLVTHSALRKQDNFVVQSLRNGRCR